MEAESTVRLRTGSRMPILGLGTWQLTDDTTGAVVEALRLGYRMIDTAVDYRTQPGIGEALRRSPVPREDVFLVTKVEEHEDAYDATRRNLDELGVDYVELVLIHRPPAGGSGRELWDGLLHAKEDGLTRDIGVSNYSIDQIDDLATHSQEMPAVNQIEWSPWGWSPAMLDACREHGIIIQAYSPLTRAKRLDDQRLVEIAGAYGKTPAQALLRWNLQRAVVPLPKANRAAHLEENLAVFDFELDEAHMAQLDDLNENWSSLGSSPQYA